VPKVLDEGVSFGVTRRVQRFSDAESRRRTEAALQAWRKAIRTRADRWPQPTGLGRGVAAQGADTLVWLAADDRTPIETTGSFWLDRPPPATHPAPEVTSAV